MVEPEEKIADIGISNTLGSTELEVLQILWRQREATVR